MEPVEDIPALLLTARQQGQRLNQAELEEEIHVSSLGGVPEAVVVGTKVTENDGRQEKSIAMLKTFPEAGLETKSRFVLASQGQWTLETKAVDRVCWGNSQDT